MRRLHQFFSLLALPRLVLAFAAFSLWLAGCSCTGPGGCDFPVSCVTHCGAGGAPSTACGSCPPGTVPVSACTADVGLDDASAQDAGDDAATLDAAADDAATIDDAGNDAAPTCDRPSYPATSMATREERTAVDDAVAAFTASTGVTVDLDPSTAAVTGFSAPFPVTLDPTISDACMRALSAVQVFLTDNAAMMRVPPDMTMRACHYDDVLDMEVVRLHGGTYAGRRLIGVDNDLVVHVTRSGTIRYWAGNYLPVAARLIPQPCYDGPAIESSVVGDSLHFTHFVACVPGSTGTKVIAAIDTRTAGDSALYLDSAGFVHVARQVEVLLDASRVGTSEIESDLFCCPDASLDGCVGDYLIVDEITLEVLDELHRCVTC